MCSTFYSFLSLLLARVGEDDHGPVVMLVSERLDQVDQVGVLHLLWGEDVSLVQLLHRSCPVNNDVRFHYALYTTWCSFFQNSKKTEKLICLHKNVINVTLKSAVTGITVPVQCHNVLWIHLHEFVAASCTYLNRASSRSVSKSGRILTQPRFYLSASIFSRLSYIQRHLCESCTSAISCASDQVTGKLSLVFLFCK